MNILLILIFLMTPNFFLADTLILEKKIPFEVKGFIKVDPLGNIYHVYKNQIEKINDLGQIRNKFSKNLYGQITSMDVINPLKMLVFYQDNSILMFLDNTISDQGTGLSLEHADLEFVSNACISQNEGFWVYDPQKFTFIRLDEHFQVLYQSSNMSLITGKGISPYQMMERNNKLFINDTLQGVLVFDVQANYIKTFPFKKIFLLNFMNNQLIFIQNEHLVFYDIITFEEKRIALPNMHVWNGYFENNKLYLPNKDQIEVYTIID